MNLASLGIFDGSSGAGLHFFLFFLCVQEFLNCRSLFPGLPPFLEDRRLFGQFGRDPLLHPLAGGLCGRTLWT